MRPAFLGLDEVLAIHSDQIRRYGGTPGFRDLASLQSAIAMPAAGIGDTYFHEDLPTMAAAYLFHIVQNHPFVDGNKRVGAVAALVFLALNEIAMAMDEAELEELVIAVATGRRDKAGVAEAFRKATSGGD